MNRNDYRRALIMLRGLTQGYSGHVRLERRTLLGTLQFTVNCPADGAPLVGVLVGDRGGRWYAANLGPLARDRRDQAGLLANIDPRNIERRAIEDYALIGVARPGAGLVLSGFLNGARDVDWSAAAAAVAQLLGQKPGGEPVTSLPPSASAAEEQAELIADEARQLTDAGCVCEVNSDGADCVCPPTADVAGFSTEQPAAENAAILSLDPDVSWPESALALRALFERNAPVEPFPAPGYTFIRAPLGDPNSGEHCLIGLKVEAGAIVTLCYAVPGTFSLEPPAGLDGYAWRGAGNEGYWTTCIDLTSGEPIETDEP